MATEHEAVQVARRLAAGERIRPASTALTAAQWRSVLATLLAMGFEERAAGGVVWFAPPEARERARSPAP